MNKRYRRAKWGLYANNRVPFLIKAYEIMQQPLKNEKKVITLPGISMLIPFNGEVAEHGFLLYNSIKYLTFRA
jgi:hypothetical protein